MRKLSRLVTHNKDAESSQHPNGNLHRPEKHDTTPGIAAWIDPNLLNMPKRHHGGETETLTVLIDAVKDYQINHGSLIKLIKTEEEATILARPIGSALYPLKFPKQSFESARHLQPLYNELYAAVSSDERWLEEALRPLLTAHSFASKLWDIHRKIVHEGGYVQEMSLGIFRSDYMLHIDPRQPDDGIQPKQVEFNTFSCAGIAHSSRISAMHRHLCKAGMYAELEDEVTLPQLPKNDSVDQVVAAIAEAHAEYNGQRRQSTASSPRTTAVLMVVQPFNVNVADERPFEYALWDADVPCYHIVWGPELLSRTTLTSTKELLFYPAGRSKTLHPIEISVVYHRAGYDEEEYRHTSGIECRLRLERSRAIKCPSVLGHLAGFKMVQQALASPGALMRFLSPDKAARVVDSFAPMYPLDHETSRGKRGRELATDAEQAANHILKPSLEGGGHNVYGTAIPVFLSTLPDALWQTFILMERIHPPPASHVLIDPRGEHSGPVETELGIVGTCLWKNHPKGDQSPDGAMMLNKQAGFTLKTKTKGVDEMSVIKGYGSFDSPLLTE